MPKIVVEIDWDVPPDQDWLNSDKINKALEVYYPQTAFHTIELVAEDEEEEPQNWDELIYEWASVINQLACIVLDINGSSNDDDFAQEMIEMVTPYLGLAEE